MSVLHLGDCLDVMRGLPDASIDAVVTDPPYGLGFMGREWDKTPDSRSFQAWAETWARECLRLLKPGGHMLAFGGTRMFHRLTSGVEDAGFEIRDVLCWLYGTGFPKSLNVSKAIDKAAGATREVVGPGRHAGRESLRDFGVINDDSWQAGAPRVETAPATAAAKLWDGWGTTLKPAYEPIILARKALVGTVAANVLEHGTGAINVDGCRVDSGRWPANVVLDEVAAEALDAEVGERGGGFGKRGSGLRARDGYASTDTAASATLSRLGLTGEDIGYGDTGGASRFFYTSKASSAERELEDGSKSSHPTVKPVDLMRWLVRLITPPGGLVLDPFAGSGSTGVACAEEGLRFVGIEREAEYHAIATKRLEAAYRQGRLDL